MKKITVLLLIGCLCGTVAKAQFSASGDTNGAPFAVTPPISSGLDKVYVYKNATNAILSFTATTPSDWTWYRYAQDPALAIAAPIADVQTNATQTVLSNVQSNYGYFVLSSSGLRHYCFVVGYLPATVTDITFTTEGDVCTNLTLKVTASVDNLYYYNASALRKTLAREFSLEWNTLEWDATSKSYKTKLLNSTSSNLAYNWSVTAPLCDTYFTLTGDQIATYFGQPLHFQSALYKAVAVQANALATPQGRDGANELDKVTVADYPNGSSPSGPAPLVMDFSSNPSEAVQFYEWYVYDSEDATGTYKRYSDETLNHTFLEAGKSLVKLYVSNSTCKDSASFTMVVSESKLDCPNFFTPRSTPGENDEFRVAYRSLVKFKGTIINRWGNVLFEWTDPSKGWNGTFKGKAVSPGVYFYLIEAKGSDGIEYKKKGDINLLE
jgi:gliding motility-associated-like protein